MFPSMLDPPHSTNPYLFYSHRQRYGSCNYRNFLLGQWENIRATTTPTLFCPILGGCPGFTWVFDHLWFFVYNSVVWLSNVAWQPFLPWSSHYPPPTSVFRFPSPSLFSELHIILQKSVQGEFGFFIHTDLMRVLYNPRGPHNLGHTNKSPFGIDKNTKLKSWCRPTVSLEKISPSHPVSCCREYCLEKKYVKR